MTSTPKDELKHGLFLRNSPGAIGDNATPSNAIEYALAAEEAGWDGVFLADALGARDQSYFDPWITLSAIAAETDDIRLGTWITPVPRRQPWQLALNVATLDELSDGRVIFGAGLGAPWNYESTGFGYDAKELGERYDEALDIIVELWSGDEVMYDGEYFTIDGLALPVTPVQSPRIPIYLGCWWPNKKPVRRAARYDGFMPSPSPAYYGGELERSPENLRRVTTEVLEYYAEVADDPGDIIVVTDVPEAGPDYLDHCRGLGMTWSLSYVLIEDDDHESNLDRIREGPTA